MVPRHSTELKGKHDMSPYIRRYKFKESQKSLNLHSTTLKDRQRDSKGSQEFAQPRRRYSPLRHSNEEAEQDKREDEKVLESARQLLGRGEHRKSLLVLKSIRSHNL